MIGSVLLPTSIPVRRHDFNNVHLNRMRATSHRNVVSRFASPRQRDARFCLMKTYLCGKGSDHSGGSDEQHGCMSKDQMRRQALLKHVREFFRLVADRAKFTRRNQLSRLYATIIELSIHQRGSLSVSAIFRYRRTSVACTQKVSFLLRVSLFLQHISPFPQPACHVCAGFARRCAVSGTNDDISSNTRLRTRSATISRQRWIIDARPWTGRRPFWTSEKHERR